MWADGKWLFLWLVSLFHVEIFINIVFLSHVCNQQETMLGSFQEGWEKGEWMMIHSGFCLAGEQASAQGMGSKEHPLIPLKPKNAKLLRQHQQPSRVTLCTKHHISSNLSCHHHKMDIILCTTEKAKASQSGSQTGEPHMKLGHQQATEK